MFTGSRSVPEKFGSGSFWPQKHRIRSVFSTVIYICTIGKVELQGLFVDLGSGFVFTRSGYLVTHMTGVYLILMVLVFSSGVPLDAMVLELLSECSVSPFEDVACWCSISHRLRITQMFQQGCPFSFVSNFVLITRKLERLSTNLIVAVN